MKNLKARSFIGLGTVSALVPAVLTMKSILANVPTSLDLTEVLDESLPEIQTQEETPESPPAEEKQEEKEESDDEAAVEEEEEEQKQKQQQEEEQKSPEVSLGDAKNPIQHLQYATHLGSNLFGFLEKSFQKLSKEVSKE